MEKSLLEIFLQTYPTAKGPQNPRTWESTNTPRSQVAFLLFIRSNFMKCTNLKPEPVPGLESRSLTLDRDKLWWVLVVMCVSKGNTRCSNKQSQTFSARLHISLFLIHAVVEYGSSWLAGTLLPCC